MFCAQEFEKNPDAADWLPRQHMPCSSASTIPVIWDCSIGMTCISTTCQACYYNDDCPDAPRSSAEQQRHTTQFEDANECAPLHRISA
eukprot:10475979-Karenia_brevis.AAC.1